MNSCHIKGLVQRAPLFTVYLLCCYMTTSSPAKPSPVLLESVPDTAIRRTRPPTVPCHRRPLPLQAATHTQDWRTAAQHLVSACGRRRHHHEWCGVRWHFIIIKVWFIWALSTVWIQKHISVSWKKTKQCPLYCPTETPNASVPVFIPINSSIDSCCVIICEWPVNPKSKTCEIIYFNLH